MEHEQKMLEEDIWRLNMQIRNIKALARLQIKVQQQLSPQPAAASEILDLSLATQETAPSPSDGPKHPVRPSPGILATQKIPQVIPENDQLTDEASAQKYIPVVLKQRIALRSVREFTQSHTLCLRAKSRLRCKLKFIK